jgi:hypothetical protein
MTFKELAEGLQELPDPLVKKERPELCDPPAGSPKSF